MIHPSYWVEGTQPAAQDTLFVSLCPPCGDAVDIRPSGKDKERWRETDESLCASVDSLFTSVSPQQASPHSVCSLERTLSKRIRSYSKIIATTSLRNILTVRLKLSTAFHAAPLKCLVCDQNLILIHLLQEPNSLSVSWS